MSLTKYQRELTAMSRFLKQARELVSETLTVQQLDALLVAALNPDGIEQSNLIDRAGLKRGYASKVLADLSNLDRNKQPGPDLIESRIDPMNRVIRVIHMTRKGEQQLVKALEKSFGAK